MEPKLDAFWSSSSWVTESLARRPKRRLRTMDAEARTAEKLIPSAAPRQDPPPRDAASEGVVLNGVCDDVGLVYSYSVRETDKPRERTGSTAAGQPQASNSHSGGTPSRSNGGVTAAGAMDVDVGREWRLGLWACRLAIGTPLGKKQKQMRSEPARASPGRSTINGFSVMFLCRHGLNSRIASNNQRIRPAVGLFFCVLFSAVKRV